MSVFFALNSPLRSGLADLKGVVMSKVCLVTVNVKNDLYGITANSFSAIAPNVPLGLLDAYLASKGIESVIIDSDVERLTITDLLNRLDEEDPVLVGVIACGSNPSASTMSMVGVQRFFETLSARKTSYRTFVWGGHPTVLPQRTLTETSADWIVLGEGYETLVGLFQHVTKGHRLSDIAGLAYYHNGHYCFQPPPPLVDLDTLPAINWGKMPPSKFRAHNWHCFGDLGNRTPYANIWTNQGCPYPCEFCCINNVFGARRYRFRSMQSVVKEIDELVTKHNVKHLKILDELFIIKHPRIEEFCDLLEERNYDLNMWCFARTDSVTPKLLERLKRVGVNWVAYGIETFDEDILNSTNKRNKVDVHETIRMTRDAGINICADVISGLWDDNVASIYKTRDLIQRYEFEWLNIYPAFAYPGTPLYDNYLKQGIIDTPKSWDRYGLYSYECVPLPTKHLSSAEVLGIRDQIFSDYYKEPAILNMLERKFGTETRLHVTEMASQPLRRRILEAGCDPSLYYPAGGLKK